MENAGCQSNRGRGGSYKFQRLRERLRQAVQSGELSGKLPGERELASRYQVNAKTISKALTDLTAEGLLIRQVGRGTFVAGQVDERFAVGRTHKFRWLIREDEGNGRPQMIFDMVAARLRREGHQIEHHQVEADDTGVLAAGWATPGQLREVDGVIVHASRPSDELVADLLRRRIPLVLAACASDRITSNAVQPDYAHAVFELTEQLVWSGLQRVALARPHDCPHEAEESRRGYEAALTRNGISTRIEFEDDEAHLAASVTSDPRPQAVVTFFRDGRARVQRAFGLSDGDREPAIATVLSPGDPPPPEDSGLWYGFDKEAFVDWTVRLLLEATPGHQPRQVLLPGHLIGRLPATAVPPATEHVSSPTMTTL
jgi:hypothetical protein